MNEQQTSSAPPEAIEQPTDDPRGLVLWFANGQLGQTNPNPYWLDAWGRLPDAHRAWCGIFALWCLRQAVLTDWHWITGQGFASRLHATVSPLPADVCYFDKPYQHHALVTRVDGDVLYLVQGNYGTPGRVAMSVVSRAQKHPMFYSIAQLLPKTKPQPKSTPDDIA